MSRNGATWRWIADDVHDAKAALRAMDSFLRGQTGTDLGYSIRESVAFLVGLRSFACAKELP